MSFRDAQQAIGIDRSNRCATHGTSGLRQVTAVVETTLIEIGPEFGETGAEGVGVDPPGADFAKTGRIDHIADTRDGDELGRGCRMLARAPFLADRADAQLETRLERVQQTRFSRARPAGVD